MLFNVNKKMRFENDIYDQSCDQSYNFQHELFTNSFTNVCEKLKCCAICGTLKLNNEHNHFKFKKVMCPIN